MWNSFTDNMMTVVFFVAFLAALFYALRLRSKMSSSKAHFAFTVSATLTSCLIALLNFLTGSGPAQTGGKLLSGIRAITGGTGIPVSPREVGWFIAALGTVGTGLALFFIYRFSLQAIRNWEGPVTVNVNELAKREQDNSLGSLAFAELKRLIALRPDPIASDTAINWKQKQREAPLAPAWHELARSLFEAAFDEAVFNNHSWRDRVQSWIGEMYIFRPGAPATIPLVLFVFEDEPNLVALENRIKLFVQDGGSLEGAKLFGIFASDSTEEERSVAAGDYQIEMWPRRALLRRGLKLNLYARDLIRRFDTEVLGGTTATLKDTFVEPHVHQAGATNRKALSEVLSEWLNDPSRRHLAITGEYGQGKSTAMLEFCVRWARGYLSGEPQMKQRIPLLIELRGQSPAETDSISFLSPWAGRYGLAPKQIYNLIRSGDAIVIFEGFDELRNAGRAYDRHEHFNALWGMAYPGTKLIFTGRPNFFLDEKERNRTLRSDMLSGASGGAFTQVCEMDRLTRDEVSEVLKGFGEALGNSILLATDSHPAFFEIVSRPSMLPVVATIWGTIQDLQKQGYDLTSAMLIEHYLQATYRRKEEEVKEGDESAPQMAGYLLLPREMRELFTLAIVWKMVANEARNTISRASFNSVISQIYDDVLILFQKEGVPAEATRRVRTFEERFRDETREDRIERICNEVASAGLFVPDPAGGPSNLRLPHKQFYEYLIAKASWTILIFDNSLTTRVLLSIGRKNAFAPLVSEQQSLIFFSELIESDFSIFRKYTLIFYFTSLRAVALALSTLRRLYRFKQRKTTKVNNQPDLNEEESSNAEAEYVYVKALSRVTSTGAFILILSMLNLTLFQFIGGREPTWTFYITFFAVMLLVFMATPIMFSSAIATALQRIITNRLRSAGEPREGEAALISIYEECVLVLLVPSRSKILAIRLSDPRREANVNKIRELIAPIA